MFKKILKIFGYKPEYCSKDSYIESRDILLDGDEIIKIKVHPKTEKITNDEKRTDLNSALLSSYNKTLEFSKCKNAKEINNGYCGIFTDYFQDIYNGDREYSIICSEDPLHYYICCDGKYYDAEALDGVDSVYELPIFKENNE